MTSEAGKIALIKIFLENLLSRGHYQTIVCLALVPRDATNKLFIRSTFAVTGAGYALSASRPLSSSPRNRNYSRKVRFA